MAEVKPVMAWAVVSDKHGMMNRLDRRKYALEGLCFAVGGNLVTDGRIVRVEIRVIEPKRRKSKGRK